MGKYIKDYERLRRFLRYLSFGCYQKQYLARLLGGSARSYEEYWARVRFFLPENRLRARRVGHKEIHALAGDAYQNQQNFLALSYEMKGITKRRAADLLLTLALLASEKTPVDEQTLLLRLELLGADEPPSRSTLHRTLVELSGLGILSRERRAVRDVYQLRENPLARLTQEEARMLYAALAFARALLVPALPGYHLAAALRALFPSLPALPPAPFQVKHVPLARILDDEAASVILACLREGRTAMFLYRGKQREALPLNLFLDFWRGRGYLRCLPVRRQPAGAARQSITVAAHADSLRLDQIESPQPGDIVTATRETLPERKHSLRLAFSYADEAEKERLLYRLRERFPAPEDCVTTDTAAGVFSCALAVTDELSLLPWLRTFFPRVRIIESSRRLQKQLRSDLEEALNSYGIPVP